MKTCTYCDRKNDDNAMSIPAYSIEAIARVCHETNRAFCEAIGDTSQVPFDQAPDWQIDSTYAVVKMHIEHPEAGPYASHNAWMQEKIEAGWTYGPVKDAEAKTHPCLVPFHELPADQQMKDILFRNIVRMMTEGVGVASV